MSELKGKYELETKDYWYCKTDGHITPFNPPCHCLECGQHIKTLEELKPIEDDALGNQRRV